MFKRIVIAIAVISFLTVGFFGSQAMAKEKQLLSLGTGDPGGTYYFVGAGFASIWNKKIPDVRVIAESTAASFENLVLVSRGKLDMAISVSSVQPKGHETVDMSDVRLLCSSSYGSHYHWIVREDSDIKNYKDLKGKKVSLGAPGSGTLVSATAMVKAWGWDPEKDMKVVNMTFTEAVNALRDKVIDCGVVAAAAPVASVQDLATTTDIRILNISKDQFVELNKVVKLYDDFTIPAGTYNGVDYDVTTLASPTFLIINKDIDKDLAYQLTKTLFENEEAVKKIHPAAGGFNKRDAFKGLEGKMEDMFVPFHEGAIKYYKEEGIWDEKYELKDF